MPRLRNAPNAQRTAATTARARHALREKTNTARLYSDDGDTETLVKDSKASRRRPRPNPQDEQEYVMTGALVTSDRGRERADSSLPDTIDEPAESHALPKKPNKRPPRTVRKFGPSEVQTKVLEGLKQRMAATARGQRVQQKTKSRPSVEVTASPPTTAANARTPPTAATDSVPRADVSPSPSASPRGRSGFPERRQVPLAQPSSVMRPHATPAVEASMLALKNFKRRPRQPSMLAMVRQRTASARPSMAGASTMDDSRALDLELDLGSDVDDIDLGDFAPEAEGTPLVSSNIRRRSSISSQRPPQPEVVSGRRGRKRKSDDVDSPMASQAKVVKRTKQAERKHDLSITDFPAHASRTRLRTSQPSPAPQVAVMESAPSTQRAISGRQTPGREEEEQVIVPSTDPEHHGDDHDSGFGPPDDYLTDEHLDDAMAEPASSSPPQVVPSGVSADYLADPLTQASPPPPARPSRRKAKAVSTTTLQSLLPKPRKKLESRQRRTEYDMASESEEDAAWEVGQLDEDEDELNGGVRRRAKTTASNAKAGRKGRQTKTMATTKRPSRVNARKSAPSTKPRNVTKTYGRTKTTSDKENDGHDSDFEEADEPTLPDVSISMLEASKTTELEEAKRKFAEVDNWDMEFESMSFQDQDRSSSQSWR